MIERKVDPALLEPVHVEDGVIFPSATVWVLPAEMVGGKQYLNTYSRTGKLITSRGYTVPITNPKLETAQ